MARKQGRQDRALAERIEWITQRLADYGEGVHHLGEPAVVLDSMLPAAVDAVLREFNGAQLFHESLILFASTEIIQNGNLWSLGSYGGDDIMVNKQGVVFRIEQDTGETLPEGTRFDRFLAGVVDAESLLYEKDGEFKDEVFDSLGELTGQAAIQLARKQLGRDPGAVAPRWRLARELIKAEKLELARENLETVVAALPSFPWPWFDLSRISEKLGQLELACDEAEMAANSDEDYEHRAYFFGHAARLALLIGEDDRSTGLAQKALILEPRLPSQYRDGAKERLLEDDKEGARELLELAKALKPTDLETITMLKQL